MELAGPEAHHAAHVLRLKVGAEVELFDGAGGVATGHVRHVGRGVVRVEVEGAVRTFDRPTPIMHLAFAVPKDRRMNWMLEKATELAAASLRPIVFERSFAGGPVEKLSVSKRERWWAQCIAAVRQSGLNWVPELHDPQRLETFLATAPTGLRLVGVGREDIPAIRDVLADGKAVGEVCLLVGPEGGLTDDELTAAKAAGFQPVRLGHTTLRVETAGVALLAVARAMCGCND